jgi:hypothetical protein
MSSEVFALSAMRNPEPAEAIRLAVERAEVNPGRIQDAVFGFEGRSTAPGLQDMAHKAGLTCSAVGVSSGLRAVFFGAQSILSDGLELIAVAGVDGHGASAVVLAGPESIGRWNVVPRARLAARSLQGIEAALRQAGIESEELAVVKQSESGARLLCELLDELETRQARWGMMVVGELALLVERV